LEHWTLSINSRSVGRRSPGFKASVTMERVTDSTITSQSFWRLRRNGRLSMGVY